MESIRINLDHNCDNYDIELKRLAIKLLSDNGYEIGEYNPHSVSCFLVQNDHNTCLSIGDNICVAVDNCVDNNLWDSMLMSQDDYKEYNGNGWHDSYIQAGNASEPFWCEHLRITKIITA